MKLKPIKTEQDYNQAIERLEVIFDAIPGTKEGDELESDTNIYISPSGDKLKIICKYGYIG